MKMSAQVWAMLIALSVLWGGSFFFAEIALTALPPLTLVTARVALAALTLWAVLWLTGLPAPRGRAVWLAGLGMGALNNALPFSLLFWGQTQIGAGLAAILNATTPIFTVIVAHLVLADERATPAKWAGVLLGFAGVVAVIGPDAVAGLGQNLAAQLAVLGCALSYGLAGSFGRRFKRLGVRPAQAATLQVTCSTALMLPVALWVDRA